MAEQSFGLGAVIRGVARKRQAGVDYSVRAGAARGRTAAALDTDIEPLHHLRDRAPDLTLRVV